MLRYVFYIILAILSFESLSLAIPSTPSPNIFEEQVTISQIAVKSRELCTRFQPDEVAHIVDKDGTLTRHSRPVNQQKAEPRGHADLVLKEQIRIGSPVVVSSAWDDFSTTIHGLQKLGLEEALHLSAPQLQPIYVSGCANQDYEYSAFEKLRGQAMMSTNTGASPEYLDAKAREQFQRDVGYIKVAKLGNVVSCQEVYLASVIAAEEGNDMMHYLPRFDYYSRAKWRALDFIEGGPVSPKVVCVWEDSPGNLEMFKEKMHLAAWYQTVEQVYLWELSSPNGEIYAEDIIHEFQSVRPMKATAIDETRQSQQSSCNSPN